MGVRREHWEKAYVSESLTSGFYTVALGEVLLCRGVGGSAARGSRPVGVRGHRSLGFALVASDYHRLRAAEPPTPRTPDVRAASALKRPARGQLDRREGVPRAVPSPSRPSSPRRADGA